MIPQQEEIRIKQEPRKEELGLQLQYIILTWLFTREIKMKRINGGLYAVLSRNK